MLSISNKGDMKQEIGYKVSETHWYREREMCQQNRKDYICHPEFRKLLMSLD